MATSVSQKSHDSQTHENLSDYEEAFLKEVFGKKAPIEEHFVL